MPKFESSRLNAVAVIAKTYTHIHTYPHTHILPNLGNTLKKIFAVIDSTEVDGVHTCPHDWFNMVHNIALLAQFSQQLFSNIK